MPWVEAARCCRNRACRSAPEESAAGRDTGQGAGDGGLGEVVGAGRWQGGCGRGQGARLSLSQLV